ncbi:MAG: hypothetical protein WBB68_05205 [Candidatus Moraniibacteriota bacterium]
MQSKLIVALLCSAGMLAAPLVAESAEVLFNPSAQSNGYDMDGNGVLHLWGVPEASGNALVANPDYGWPTVSAIAAWYATLLKAQEMNLSVSVGYDPTTLDIWYVGKPR